MLIRYVWLTAFVTLAACSRSSTEKLAVYDTELREKSNTCRPLDPQVAFETIFIQHHGAQAVLHLGAEHTFVVDVTEEGYRSHFSESDHTTVEGRHVVCKRMTDIDLTVEGNKIEGSYTRQRRQECMIETKPCQTIWSVNGKLRPAAP